MEIIFSNFPKGRLLFLIICIIALSINPPFIKLSNFLNKGVFIICRIELFDISSNTSFAVSLFKFKTIFPFSPFIS